MSAEMLHLFDEVAVVVVVMMKTMTQEPSEATLKMDEVPYFSSTRRIADELNPKMKVTSARCEVRRQVAFGDDPR